LIGLNAHRFYVCTYLALLVKSRINNAIMQQWLPTLLEGQELTLWMTTEKRRRMSDAFMRYIK